MRWKERFGIVGRRLERCNGMVEFNMLERERRRVMEDGRV